MQFCDFLSYLPVHFQTSTGKNKGCQLFPEETRITLTRCKYLCWLASTSITNKRQQITLFCEARLTKNFPSTQILPAQRFYVLSSDYEHRTDTCQTFFGQTNIAQTCVTPFGDILCARDTTRVSTDVIRKQRLFSNFADKLDGAINRPCSIGVLCTIATRST